MTLRQALYRNCSGDYYVSPEGWILKTSNEGDGYILDPKTKTVKWTGHNGDKLSEEMLNSPVEKMEYIPN